MKNKNRWSESVDLFVGNQILFYDTNIILLVISTYLSYLLNGSIKCR